MIAVCKHCNGTREFIGTVTLGRLRDSYSRPCVCGKHGWDELIMTEEEKRLLFSNRTLTPVFITFENAPEWLEQVAYSSVRVRCG